MTTLEKVSSLLGIVGGIVGSVIQGASLIRVGGGSEGIGRFLFCLALPVICIVGIHIGWKIRRDDVEAIKDLLTLALTDGAQPES
jgi:hypothetical protein